jgi:PAS domain S-box-containing protein
MSQTPHQMSKEFLQSILVVNDEPGLRNLMSLTLTEAGYLVLTACDGQEGLDVVRTQSVDMVISDVVMPVMDGIELCRRLRSDQSLSFLPILLFSSLRADTPSALEGMRAGADDYLEASYDPMRLIARVARLIERRQAEKALLQARAALEERVAERTVELQQTNQALIENVAERDRAHAAFRKEAMFVELLKRVAVAANGTPDLDEAAKICIEAVCSLTNWDVGHLYMLSQIEPSELVPSDVWHISDAAHFEPFRQVTDGIRIPSTVGLCGKVVTTGKPFWSSDIQNDLSPTRAGVAASVGFKTCFAFPVMAGSTTLAVLEFFSTNLIELDQDLVEVTPLVGVQLGRVAERNRAQQELRESHTKISNILESITDAFLTIDREWRYTYMNSRASLLLQHPGHALLGRNVWEVFPDAVETSFYVMFNKAMNERVPVEFVEYYERLKAWFEIKVYPSPEGVSVYFRDVTSRKRAEQEMERLVAIMEATTDLVGITDLQGRVSYMNRAGRKMMGIGEQEEIINSSITEFHPAPTNQIMLSEIIPTALEHGVWRGETVLLRRDGRQVPVSQVLLSHKGTSGQVEYLSTIIRDITEHKQSELQLYRAHEEKERLLAAIPSILIGLNKDLQVTAWNRAAVEVLGIEEASALGQTLQDCSVEWNLCGLLDHALCDLETDRQKRLDDVRFKRPDGTERTLGFTVNLFEAGEQKQTGYLVLGSDVTERRRLESKLLHAQKLESIGQLAAGIAHEINTPTQYVGDNTRFLLDSFNDLIIVIEKLSDLFDASRSNGVTPELIDGIAAALRETDIEYLGAEIPNAIEQSLEGIKQIGKIVQSMKEFAHPGSSEKQAVDLNRAIESTITVARNEWKYVAEMETDLDPSLPMVPCLLGEFNQVILNLIINAAHSIADVLNDRSLMKGRIKISTRHTGDWAEVQIRDSGSGIPEEIRSRIFDPFFTTKEVGKGTGQGLAISHAVVEKHGGAISFETEEGRGTTFTVRLPLIEQKQAITTVSE